MKAKLLICTDLDRTLLPNGEAEENPEARPRFKCLTAHPEVILAYVSGRDENLVRQAMAEYDLPQPDWVVGDVGTTIYGVDEPGNEQGDEPGDRQGQWTPVEAWATLIGKDWQGADHARLADLFADLSVLTLQEPSKQNHFKLSYYASHDLAVAPLLNEMSRRLDELNVKANLIWSIDETTQTGLLDVIPRNATKKHAVEFLIAHLGLSPSDVVYAGDSGNDLPVFVSSIPSVLVANATPEIKAEAQNLISQKGVADTLYFAQGGFLGLNGNYAAGILEGVAHYRPQTQTWMGVPAKGS